MICLYFDHKIKDVANLCLRKCNDHDFPPSEIELSYVLRRVSLVALGFNERRSDNIIERTGCRVGGGEGPHASLTIAHLSYANPSHHSFLTESSFTLVFAFCMKLHEKSF